jgi:hypothetical protein
MSDYARTNRGRRFHRSTCGYLTWCKWEPWPEVDGLTPRQVFDKALVEGINAYPAKCCCSNRDRYPTARSRSSPARTEEP